MKRFIFITGALLSSLELSAGFTCQNDGYSIDIEFLYWSFSDNYPVTADISATTITAPSVVPLEATYTNFDLQRGSDRFCPSFRIGIGWAGYDCWDMKALYTCYYNQGIDHLNGHLETNWPFGELTRSLNYYVADWELGKSLVLSTIAIRPFCGVRAAWINQKHHIALRGFSAPFTTPDGEIIVEQPRHSDSCHQVWAVGPRIGVDTTWGNFCGISLLANISFSALYGRETARFLSSLTSLESELEIESINNTLLKTSFNQVIPGVQTFFGLSWDTKWSRDLYVNFKAGWESVIWWNTTNIQIFDKSLGLQGLTAAMQFDF